ncbi:MAG: hypothetical protein H6577_09230 [Lewinellaceae bacterium]|nr:hypothetical protein [Saprospiraceae bacterium]MCB9338297.1 hypothetical protein [Lewinellaceae bacterium]
MGKYFWLLAALLFGTASFSQPTQIYVRAKAKDAKFIGSSIGGALIVFRKADTGEILAQGLTEGGTGNTNLIMSTPHERYKPIATDGAAKFEALLNLPEPTFVTIEAHAPFTRKQATAIATTQLWLIPGKHILGEGIVLEIPGFIVDVLAPRTHQAVSLKNSGGKVAIEVNVVMMCGCTVSPGGLWDGEGFDVKAWLKKDGKRLAEVKLNNTANNTFTGEARPTEAGNYEIIVYAFDPKTGNSGVDKVNFVVE